MSVDVIARNRLRTARLGRVFAAFGAALFLGALGSGCRGSTPADPSRPPESSREADPDVPGLTPGDPALTTTLARALAAKGQGYRPRTRHRKPDGSPTYTNRLILETSPYLLQHAHNPVNWYPWGDAAFERARREDKSVLLSIGYSTCHWCHVMEVESFEDVEIARYLNENFVAIKVDREARPDVDAVYMNAVQSLTGRGGWPLTVALTPAREPFFGGTYFPPRDGDRGVRKGFLSIVRELAGVYRQEPDRVAAIASQLTARLQAEAKPAPPGDLPGAAAIRNAAVQLTRSFDDAHGGFGAAPKFPVPSNLELLARYYRHTKDPYALHMLTRTLERMAAGGIHDHVGGGFHRYATDERWLVPHFEKMLYDNAQLAVAYLEGYQLTGREDFARVARTTLDYLEREMSDPAGGFYAATDADSPVAGKSESEEGWYFTWTVADLRGALGSERAARAAEYYGVTERGNFEGRNILNTLAASSRAEIESIQAALLAARMKRSPPLRDETVIAAWNGLAISAFARGAGVLNEPRYAARAARAASFVVTRMKAGDRLRRTHREGRLYNEGLLDDYAFVAQGLLDLYEATHEIRWLSEAIALQATLAARFQDGDNGGFFATPTGHETLLTRGKPDYDGAEPSGNSVAALNLLRLEEFSGDARYRAQAERLLRAFQLALNRGTGIARMLVALDYALDEPIEIVLVAPRPGAAGPLEAIVQRTFVPNRIFVSAVDGRDLTAQAKLVPLLAEKRALGGKATAYVCRSRTCDRPTSDPEVLARQLAVTAPLFSDVTPAPLSSSRVAPGGTN